MNFSRKILYQIEVEDFSLLIIKLLIFIILIEKLYFKVELKRSRGNLGDLND